MADHQAQIAQNTQQGQAISRPPSYAPELEPAEMERVRVNYVKWGLGCAGVFMLLASIGTMFALIVTPVVFRNMLPEQQQIWMHRLPFLAAFKPTRIFQGQYLPTVGAGDSVDANSLLTPSDPGVAVAANPDELVASPTPLPTETPTPTATPGKVMPTSVLASNTPVISTALPTATVPVSPTPIPTATVVLPTLPPTEIPVPSSAFVTGIKFVQQGWNNCGPANVTQVLHKFGWTGTQNDAAAYLKPWTEDKNVSPWQIVTYVNNNFQDTLGLRALYRYGGTLRLLKLLMANDFGVIIEKGDFIVGEGWMGHYLTMQGYDDYATANDKAGVAYGMDTNRGPSGNGNGRPFSYDELDSRWRQFNRIFIVIYPTAREGELAKLLGNYADEEWSVRAALNTAQREASELGSDAYAWYNIGTNLTLLKDYKRAAAAYDQALKIGLEWRTFWYEFSQYDAWYNLGYYDEILVQTDTVLQTTSDGKGLGLEEQHYWRGMVYAAKGDNDQATREFELTLNWNKNFTPAQEALAQVQTGRFQAPEVAQN